VVQGSVLGPLLFSMFINEFTNAIESSHYHHMYADDVQLYISCHPFEYAACVRKLNLDSDRIQGWSRKNGLYISASKSQAMVVNPRQFQLDGSKQIFLGANCNELHQKVKNLGLMMNCNLTWDDQVSKICRNVFFTLKRL
jgi:hypothetical protein